MLHLYYGGSFNPVHNGHLICARAVAEAAGYARVVLLPSHQPPHKPGATSDLAPAADRLAMCRLAATQDPLFDVDDLELTRTGPSYTIDTVGQLKQRGVSKVHWLIGADMLRLLPQWHRPTELIREVHFVIMARPGWSFDWDTMPVEFQQLRAQVVQSPLIDISGTDVRERVRNGKSIAFLTPDPVREHIERNRLYRDVPTDSPG